MSRATTGTSNFVKGLTDSYLSQDLAHLEVAENLCLDSDLTTIQRPGSAYQSGTLGSNASKHVDQNNVSGLSAHGDDIYSTDTATIYHKDLAAVPLDFAPITNISTYAYNHSLPDDAFINNPHLGVTPVVPAVVGFSLPDLATSQGITFHAESADYNIITYQDQACIPYKVGKFTSSDDIYGGSDPYFTDRPSAYSVGLPRFPNIVNLNGDGLDSFATVNDAFTSNYPHGYGRLAGTIGTLPGFRGEGLFYNDPASPGNYTNAFFTLGLPPIPDQNKPHYYYGKVHNPGFPISKGICFTFVHKYKIGDKTFIKESAPSDPFYIWSTHELFGNQSVSNGNAILNFGLTLNGSELRNYLSYFGYKMLYSPVVIGGSDNDKLPYGLNVLMYCTENIGSIFYRQTICPYVVDTVESCYAFMPGGLYKTTALYTTGGVLENEPPPACKYVKQIEAFTYYGNCMQVDAGGGPPVFSSFSNIGSGINYAALLPSRYKLDYSKYIYQSSGNDPDTVSGGNYVAFPSAVQGIGNAGPRVVVGTTDSIYRIDGKYDDLGGGIVVAELLSAETGIISHRSMVTVGRRCVFLGKDGVYFTDGVDVVKVSSHIDQFYRSLVSTFTSDSYGYTQGIDISSLQLKIDGFYDKYNDRVIWTFGDRCLVLEFKSSDMGNGTGSFWGPWLYGKNDGSNKFQCISKYKDTYAFGDDSGYVRMVSSGYMGDPRNLNDATDSSTWGVWPILYRLKTIKSVLNNGSMKKWVSHVNFVFKRRKVFNVDSEENLDVDINSYNDGYRVVSKLKPVHYTGSEDLLHDSPVATLAGNLQKIATDTLISLQRRFTAPGLRCITKAVELVNGMHLEAKSDDYETCLASGTSVSLPNYPTYSWPTNGFDPDAKFYVISFEAQQYLYKYVITGYDPATLTVNLTPMGYSAPVALPASSKWKLYSFSNKQFFGVSGLSMNYEVFNSEQGPYGIQNQGGNVGDKAE